MVQLLQLQLHLHQLKKYLLLNARIIGFNSDPRFNDALDGLMLLDLTKLPEKTVEDLKRGMNEAIASPGAREGPDA